MKGFHIKNINIEGIESICNKIIEKESLYYQKYGPLSQAYMYNDTPSPSGSSGSIEEDKYTEENKLLSSIEYVVDNLKFDMIKDMANLDQNEFDKSLELLKAIHRNMFTKNQNIQYTSDVDIQEEILNIEFESQERESPLIQGQGHWQSQENKKREEKETRERG